ncbi:hypothetical protein GCM10023160_04110 [Brachybacterium paraconglomeratum]
MKKTGTAESSGFWGWRRAAGICGGGIGRSAFTGAPCSGPGGKATGYTTMCWAHRNREAESGALSRGKMA